MEISLSQSRAPFIFIISSAVIALALALGIVIVILNPPARDIQLLVLFMGATALITLTIAYIFQRLNILARFPSLSWIVPVTIILTAALIVFNVWVTARLMFISDHDFYLTTALLIFASLIAIGFGVYITTHLTRRIQHLSSAAQMLAQGDFGTRLEIQGSDEIAQLAKTFNWMTESLEKMDEQKRAIDQARRDLIAWVSHDLRTPLASMRAMLEAIDDGMVSDTATQERYIKTSLQEIEHLSHLINDLFDLAKIDTGQLQLDCERKSIQTVVNKTVQNLTEHARKKSVTIDADHVENLPMVSLDAHRMQQVLYNLVDNAIRYAPEGTTVCIKASQTDNGVRVDVNNTGSVIEPDDLPHIFESFYRAEKSRTVDHDGRRGTGLGLTIAKRFIELHNGKIWVDSSESVGTTFSFELPY